MFDAESGLLQAILDEPYDDAVRLVYADHLEERGDPRGEFIRIQLKLARGGDGEDWAALAAREKTLLDRHFDDWAPGVRPFLSHRVSIQFRRGFLEEVEIDLGADKDLAVLRHVPR